MAAELQKVLEPGEGIGFEVAEGQTVRLFQVEEKQVADMVTFSVGDPDERLSMYMSRAINHTWNLTEGHVLVSTEGKDLWEIVRDTAGHNYSGGGYCNKTVNERRSGRGDAANCEDNLVAALQPYGLTRRSFDADTCFNIFMRVGYPASEEWVIEPPTAERGDAIVMRALRPQIVGLSNCPQVLNAANDFSLKPLGLEVTA